MPSWPVGCGPGWANSDEPPDQDRDEQREQARSSPVLPAVGGCRGAHQCEQARGRVSGRHDGRTGQDVGAASPQCVVCRQQLRGGAGLGPGDHPEQGGPHGAQPQGGDEQPAHRLGQDRALRVGPHRDGDEESGQGQAGRDEQGRAVAPQVPPHGASRQGRRPPALLGREARQAPFGDHGADEPAEEGRREVDGQLGVAQGPQQAEEDPRGSGPSPASGGSPQGHARRAGRSSWSRGAPAAVRTGASVPGTPVRSRSGPPARGRRRPGLQPRPGRCSG